MRGLKSAIALLVVLLGLGSYIYFYTWKHTDDSTATKQDVSASVDLLRLRRLLHNCLSITKFGYVLAIDLASRWSPALLSLS